MSVHGIHHLKPGAPPPPPEPWWMKAYWIALPILGGLAVVLNLAAIVLIQRS